MARPPGVTRLEVAAGGPIGYGPAATSQTLPGAPFGTLETLLEAAVASGPCAVAFSGGRDSSLVLAAAVAAARRIGAPDPVPVTGRVDDDDAQEDRWAELVLEHLRLDTRRVVDIGDGADLLGEPARRQLRTVGPLFPPNAHLVAALAGAVPGGTVLVGLGGDELFGHHRWTVYNELLARRRRPEVHDLARTGAALLPHRWSGRLYERRTADAARTWLTPAAARHVARLERRAAGEPVRFDRAVRHAASSRTLAVARQSLDRLGAEHGVSFATPLLEPPFVESLARAGGARGWGGRTAVMRALADDVLPREVVERSTKAVFTRSLFGPASRAFAERWRGGGVDTELVDLEALRREWLSSAPDFRSALLLQCAWLAEEGGGR